jgi:translation elongation factor EF-G
VRVTCKKVNPWCEWIVAGWPPTVQGLKIALTDGATHPVDSSELAFKLASMYAFRNAYESAAPVILEPIMQVRVGRPGCDER